MKLLKEFLENELKLDSEKYMPEFIGYEQLILEWNKKINLVSRRADSIEAHIVNSIFFLTKYKLNDEQSIADIGTGGGFPGIPLKILFPEKRILLVDSIQKKIMVLKDIIEKMNLKDIEAVWGRAEEVSKESTYKNKYDAVISKAVSSLENLYSWNIDFLNKRGKILSIKGGKIENELTELNKLKYNFTVEVINFDLNSPYAVEDKKLIIIKNEN